MDSCTINDNCSDWDGGRCVSDHECPYNTHHVLMAICPVGIDDCKYGNFNLETAELLCMGIVKKYHCDVKCEHEDVCRMWKERTLNKEKYRYLQEKEKILDNVEKYIADNIQPQDMHYYLVNGILRIIEGRN